MRMNQAELRARACDELAMRVEMIAILVNDVQGIDAVLGAEAGGELRRAMGTVWAYYSRMLTAVRDAGWMVEAAAAPSDVPATPAAPMH